MTLITYKDLTGNTVDLTESFTGFEIKKEYGKFSSIVEYSNGDMKGTITFRPTKIPVIFSVKYGNYREERYSHGGVSAVYSVNNENKLTGEYRRYNSDGSLKEVRFYNSGEEVTQDIMLFLNFNGTEKEFTTIHNLGEDERFNIWMQYGGFFKFIHEYSYNSIQFNKNVEYCLE